MKGRHSPRLLVVKLLEQVLDRGTTLSEALASQDGALQDPRDQAFAKALCFETLRWLPPTLFFGGVIFFVVQMTRQGGLGALIAIIFKESVLWQERLKKMASSALLVTTSLVLILVLMPNREQLYNNIPIRLTGYSVLAIMGGSLIVISLTHNKSSLLRRFLRNKVLRFFGKYSYALYLIHALILQIFLDILWDAKFRGWQAYVSYLFISFSLTIILSLLSWHVLEKQMLKLKKYFE